MVTDWRSRDENEHLSWNNEPNVLGAVGSISLIEKALVFGLCRISLGLQRGLMILKYTKCPKSLSCVFC